MELWHNGNQIFSVKRPIFKPGAKNGEWKYGLYVGDPNHGTRQVYTDEFYAGDNFNSIGEFLNATTYGLSCPIPTGLTVSNITDTTACLDWDNVSDTVVYDLLWREKGGQWTVVDGIILSEYPLTGLTACNTYEWQVRTSCNSENSIYTSISRFSTKGEDCKVTNSRNDNYNYNNIMVYPNPSQDGKFTVKMPEAGRVQVTNLLGKEVFSKVFLAGEHQINLSDQRKGIYSFRIAAGKTMKLIVN